MSEALILESVNPQYDERLFIEFQEKYKLTTCCVLKLVFCFDIQVPRKVRKLVNFIVYKKEYFYNITFGDSY